MKLTEAKALNRIASYCSKAERCEYDALKKLQGWELLPEEISRIMDRLKKERFIDNKRFCRSFVNDKLRFNKWGRTKIMYELRKRMIPESIYTSILDEYSTDEFEKQLDQILKTKERTVKAKDKYDKRNKLLRFALGRGFSMDLSLKCVNKLIKDADEDCY